MRIIFSPTKKMVHDEYASYQHLPVFLDETSKILAYLQSLSFEELKKLWKCNDKLAKENYERIQDMDLRGHLTPALFAYTGLAFSHLAPNILSEEAYQYLEEHLRILSGFYGVLKPFDGVTPYRLEMQSKTKIEGYKDLYMFWDYKLYEEVIDESHLIINLASKEYAKCIENFLSDEDLMVTIVFGEYKNGKVISKGTKAKMARGEMVRYLAMNRIEDLEGIKGFDAMNYQYDKTLSDERTYYFIENDVEE
ncbi:peroxide stress protein YaaA [Sharpea azabuensis]|uniref:peroxide stress protein YaaA n=1 Tax=Sharpea azabuensis TaxID=322505 RepID=UPI00240984F4|nr:peroxide stress protein YaaA [Sharpea azabuensis]MDD6511881.1 peroxide stress protein YaaA [Sharpea azabuensis]